VRYLVDGMNLIGSRPDGWWRDRPGSRRALVAELSTLAVDHEVTVVFDGRPEPGEVEDAARLDITARFAPGGPNAADDAIANVVEQDPDRTSLVVVSSDGALVRRVQTLGADVLSTGAFRRQLET
jgi:predicted RNA-binding protein with PIN domain